MQAVGNQVLLVASFIFIPIITIIVYYRNYIKQFYRKIFGRNIQRQGQDDGAPVRFRDSDCSICLENPKVLEVSATCGHSFCGECLFDVYHRQNNKISCPLCRKPVTTIFKCFEQDDPNQRRQHILNQIRAYNREFDDNRSIFRRLLEFPYVWKKIKATILSGQFIVFFIRSIYFLRFIIIVIAYLLNPFDLIPQFAFGIVGYIDDAIITILVLLFMISIVAVSFMRNH